jgi:O-methyltransferase
MRFLYPINFQGGHFGIAESDKFNSAFSLLKESLPCKGQTVYSADNLITWGRNYSFLRQSNFVEIVNSDNHSHTEKSIIWRTCILLFFAEFSSHAPGDFLEVGCHTGYTAEIISERINLAEKGKKYFLYDLFSKISLPENRVMKGHNNPNMYAEVLARFLDKDYVKIIKGSVPESFRQGFPDQIAFCHIDLNNAVAEAASLREILPRLASGGSIVFDDYGWIGYSDQKLALDPIIDEFGLKILELPTGQGVLLKP